MHKLQQNSSWNELRPVLEAWSGRYSALVQSYPSGLILGERQSCQMFHCGIAVVRSNMRILLRLWNRINPTEATLSLFSEVKLEADGRSRMAHPTALLGLTLDGLRQKLWNLISRWAKCLEGHRGSTWGSLCVWPALLSSWAWCSVPEPCAMRAVTATVDSAGSCFKGCIVWDFGSSLHLTVPGSFTEELIPALFGNWWYWKFKMNLIMYVKASNILFCFLWW